METNENEGKQPEKDAQDSIERLSDLFDESDLSKGTADGHTDEEAMAAFQQHLGCPADQQTEITEYQQIELNELDNFLNKKGNESQKEDEIRRIMEYNKEICLDEAAAANPALKPVIEAHREFLLKNFRFIELERNDLGYGWTIINVSPAEYVDIAYTGKDNLKQFIKKSGLESKITCPPLGSITGTFFSPALVAITLIEKLESESRPVSNAFAEAAGSALSFTIKTLGDLAEIYHAAGIVPDDASELRDYLIATCLYDKEINLKLKVENANDKLAEDASKVRINKKEYALDSRWKNQDDMLKEVTSFDRLMGYSMEALSVMQIDINSVTKQAENFVQAARDKSSICMALSKVMPRDMVINHESY